MDNFRGNDRGGRGGGGGFRSGGARGFKARSDRGGGFDRDSRPVTMHSAVCSSCGKSCEVPFMPSGDKPVYCRDCFAGRSAMGGDRSSRPDPRGGNRFDSNRSDRPAPRFNAPTGGNDDVKRQLESINYKLDKLITALIGGQKPQAPKNVPTVTIVKEKNTDSLKTIVDNAIKSPEKKESKKSAKKVSKKK